MESVPTHTTLMWEQYSEKNMKEYTAMLCFTISSEFAASCHQDEKYVKKKKEEERKKKAHTKNKTQLKSMHTQIHTHLK